MERRKENPNMAKIEMYRHGDVGLVRRDALPLNAQREEPAQPDLVLAYGEVAGHAHRIVAPHKVSLWNAGAQRYILVEDPPATLTHEEHGPMTLEPGVYEVRIQREYGLGGEIRNVAD